MPTDTYTGTLADIGLGRLTGLSAAMRVRPEEEAFTTEGLISAIPVPVAVDEATGRFSISLVPSGALTASTSGRSGVDYIIEVGRFEASLDGFVFHGVDTWKFTATAGGGNVGEMKGGSLFAVWVGPPWPSAPLPRGLYIDTVPPNEWGVRS